MGLDSIVRFMLSCDSNGSFVLIAGIASLLALLAVHEVTNQQIITSLRANHPPRTRQRMLQLVTRPGLGAAVACFFVPPGIVTSVGYALALLVEKVPASAVEGLLWSAIWCWWAFATEFVAFRAIRYFTRRQDLVRLARVLIAFVGAGLCSVAIIYRPQELAESPAFMVFASLVGLWCHGQGWYTSIVLLK